MNLRNIFFLSFLSCTLIACNQSKNNGNTTEDNNIVQVSEDDKDMNEAMEKARNTFGEFTKAFKENQSNPKFDAFTIKLRFDSPKGNVEHMWIGDLSLDGNTFKGILMNTPGDTSIKQKYGDAVTIDPSKVSDWMYIEILEGDKEITRGAYTMKVMRDKLSTEEKAEFDASTGLNFED